MDSLTRHQRSKLMSRIRSSGTGPEKALRKILRSVCAHSVRLNDRTLPGTPDLVVRLLRLAVFVDGCFFHGCPAHSRIPKTNVAFWSSKIRRNRARDLRVRRALRLDGWTVVRVWEHELRLPSNVRRRMRGALARAFAATAVTSPAVQSRTMEMKTMATAPKTNKSKTTTAPAAKKPAAKKPAAPAKKVTKAPAKKAPAKKPAARRPAKASS